MRLTLGQLPDVSLVLYNEMDPRGGVHDRPHTVDTGELQKGLGDSGASSAGEPVKSLQEEV